MDNHKSQIIAIDFDGVLCINNYPKIGEANEETITYFIRRKEEGDKLILWTCRKGIYLNNAIAWCRKRGLEFDAVNENLPEIIESFRGDTRKIYADLYFDDHNFPYCQPYSVRLPERDCDIENVEPKEKNAIEEWAEKEIAHFTDRAESDYIYSCCKSALKALHALCEDPHSGFSIQLTKSILNSLIDRRPLTEITEDDGWNPAYINDNDGYIMYHSARMHSLFKKEYPDGTVEYVDTDRAIGVDISDGLTYSSSLVNDYINKVYPITMPYEPLEKFYKVYTEDFLYNEKNGDFDTRAILRVEKPDGKQFKVGHYYKETSDGWKRISKLEYLYRKARRIEK